MTDSTTVLVVDDEPNDRELVARLLRAHFRVLTAEDVPSGLAAFRAQRPHCVLLDHYMPGIEGLDGLLEFARAGATVIMMSGDGSEKLAAEAFRRGARDFIPKASLTSSILVRMITRERERRRLELELHAAREQFDEVAARIAVVLWARSLDGRFLYLSPAFEEVFGHSREGLTAEAWERFVHAEDRPLVHEAESRWAQGTEHEVEFRVVRADGETRRIRNRGYPILENGRVTRVGGIARDVTEEVRLQQELRLAQKLEAIGQLAAGVAHEINTPAQYVGDNVTFVAQAVQDLLPLLGGCVELARAEPSGSAEALARLRALTQQADLPYLIDELPAALEQTAAGMAQISKIVGAMKEFSHPSDDMKVIDLNRAIETTVTVSKNQWKYVADLELDLSPDVEGVLCRPSEINQVLLNLVVNAAHAIEEASRGSGEEKGTITITTRREHDEIVISVSDTGCGIPDAILDRIYDPFFTTKTIGKGTGQGLAIAHRIVCEHHGGSIECDSAVGRGTRFTIRLPGAPAASHVA